MTYGIDISHHQRTDSLPWQAISESCEFVICRATYGKMRDRNVLEHMQRARDEVPRVGLYHFWRPSQSDAEQVAAFMDVAKACWIQAGDIVPVLDVEDDPGSPGVSPEWSHRVEWICGELESEFGGCMIYITQRDWGRLGKPEWVLSKPLWVAHYTGAPKPATPGGVAPVIWQHRVADFDPRGPGGFDKKARLPLDQNRLLDELPLIAQKREIAPDFACSGECATDDVTPWALLRAQVIADNSERLHSLIGSLDDDP